MAKEEKIIALGKKAAYNLADVTKTRPQYGAITPKWLTKVLEFKGLDAGIYRFQRYGKNPLSSLHTREPLPYLRENAQSAAYLP